MSKGGALRSKARLGQLALGLLAIAGVFFVPFGFPPSTPSYSSSFRYGFNNRVAATVVILLAGVQFLVAMRSQPSRDAAPVDAPMQRGNFLIAAVCALLFTGVMGGTTMRTHAFTSDAAYFLTQLLKWSVWHRPLYTGLEFPYGPLLFGWPLAFQQVLKVVAVGPEAAYLVSLGALQMVGLLIAFDLLQRLPGTRLSRTAMLAVTTAVSLQPALGMNYTPVRFLFAPWAVLAVAGQRRPATQAAWAFAAQAISLGISPEVGVSFGLGIAVFSLVRAWQERRSAARRWPGFAPLGGAGLGGACFFASVSPAYLEGLHRFSGGMLNKVLSPTPQLLFFLLIAIGLAPLVAGRALGRRSAHAPGLAGCWVAALLFIPSAMGIADDLHLFFSGLALLLLASSAVRESRRATLLLAGVSCAFMIQAQLPDMLLRLRSLPQQRRELAQQTAEAEYLARHCAPGSLFAPEGLPYSLQIRLIREGVLQPDMFDGMNGAWAPDAEEIKWEEALSARYLLLPTSERRAPEADNRRRMLLLRFGWRYREGREAYRPMQRTRSAVANQDKQIELPEPFAGEWALFERAPGLPRGREDGGPWSGLP